MRATEVLQKCLRDALGSMHALRGRVLLRAVEAMVHGSRLTLIDLARSWPDAERVRAPLKALDRLLSNRHLYAERERIYKAMTRWLGKRKLGRKLGRRKLNALRLNFGSARAPGPSHGYRAAQGFFCHGLKAFAAKGALLLQVLTNGDQLVGADALV